MLSLMADYMGLLDGFPYWLPLAGSMLMNALYAYCLYKLNSQFGGDFRKAYLYKLTQMVVAFALLLIPDDYISVYLLGSVLLVSIIIRMLMFYYMLTAFSNVSSAMGDAVMARIFIIGRTIYMVSAIVYTAAMNATNSAFMYAAEIMQNAVGLFLLMQYNRLRVKLNVFQRSLDETEKK